jgi:hypothetical protein
MNHTGEAFLDLEMHKAYQFLKKDFAPSQGLLFCQGELCPRELERYKKQYLPLSVYLQTIIIIIYY